MKFTIATIFFTLVAFTYGDDSHVLDLNKSNFKEALENEYLLVEFYAPWCGHCKALEPQYVKAAEILNEKHPNIKLAKVDATVETELAEEHQVRGYPTLKFFRKGSATAVDYNGGREADQIVNWLVKKTGPPAETLTTVEQFKKFAETPAVKVVGYFTDLESAAAKTFLSYAAEVDEYPFAVTSSKDVAGELKLEKDGVALLHNFDEIGYVHHTGEVTSEELKKFITKNSLPIVIEFTHETAQKIFGGDVKIHNLLFLKKSAPESDKLVEEFKSVAKDYKGEILFVTINADVEDHERIMEFFGIKSSQLPAMRVIKLENDMLKFKPEDAEINAATIKDFVQGVLDGKVRQHLLSQDQPEDWDKQPVKVLVSTNFDSVAFDKSKNVLVEFYAPWCGHCKQLAPIYDQLAEQYQDKKDIVIAKIDATLNELEHTKINSFPTIKLYRKETNEVIEYNGERTLEGLKKFIDSDGEFGRAPDEELDEEEDKEEKPDAKRDEL